MDQLLVPSGIRFNDYIFSQPIGITACTPPGCGGVYAVLVTDPNWAPKPFQPVFFGQLGNNAPRHSILQECAALGPVAASQGVFVAVLPMPFSTSAQRNAVQRELIQAYNPLCQTDALRGQPGDIAQNHGAQAAQLMMLGGNQCLEQQREPRRRIGFVPQPAWAD